MLLPAKVRALVHNSPVRLLEALTNEIETSELFDAGLPMAADFKPYGSEDPLPDPPKPDPPKPEEPEG